MVLHRSEINMSFNIFKLCTALKSLGSVMILVVLAIVGVTYYVEVFECYGPDLFNGRLADALVAFLVLILFHALVINCSKKIVGNFFGILSCCSCFKFTGLFELSYVVCSFFVKLN